MTAHATIHQSRIAIHQLPIPGDAMTTSSTSTTSTASNTKNKTIGYAVQLAGIGAGIAGAILSLHHAAIAVCFVSGAAAFFVGEKIRTL
jgi:hypothetical protein